MPEGKLFGQSHWRSRRVSSRLVSSRLVSSRLVSSRLVLCKEILVGRMMGVAITALLLLCLNWRNLANMMRLELYNTTRQ
jgi:hypothetical protein